MFGPVKQPRVWRLEPADLHADIVLLRKTGHEVWRGGRHTHMVDGRTADDQQLRSLAAAVRRRQETATARRTERRPNWVRRVLAALWARVTAIFHRPEESDASQRAEGAGQ